jgi:hypothetical protein
MRPSTDGHALFSGQCLYNRVLLKQKQLYMIVPVPIQNSYLKAWSYWTFDRNPWIGIVKLYLYSQICLHGLVPLLPYIGRFHRLFSFLFKEEIFRNSALLHQSKYKTHSAVSIIWDCANRFMPYCFWLIFERCWVRISAGIQTILIEVFVVFFRPSRLITGYYPKSGYNRFLSHFIRFVAHYNLINPPDRAIVWLRKRCISLSKHDTKETISYARQFIKVRPCLWYLSRLSALLFHVIIVVFVSTTKFPFFGWFISSFTEKSRGP